MPSKPETWTIEKLRTASLGRAAILSTKSASHAVRDLPFEAISSLDSLDIPPDTLIVVGGGSLMDRAKYWRWTRSPQTRLIAIPSIWGSGAEASPVAVLDGDAGKQIFVDDGLLPDVRCVWPELAQTVPPERARAACGDAWAHALEGFLSPLGDESLQRELAGIIRHMLTLPLAPDPGWFEPSAQACAAQARASVGLVHGIAHVLEHPLREAFPGSGWGHAKLCSVFLWPVMAFNREHSDKLPRLCAQFDIDEDAVWAVLRDLHSEQAYDEALPLLETHWMTICRDPCSRTNSVLVRPTGKAFFTARTFR